MDAINNKDTSSNHMQKYVEGNNGYISPITSSGYLNHINSKPVNDTETMDFTDIDVDSILAEEDPYADESNKISSKPIYGKTFGTEVKFTKGYNNVYDASSESNEINLNTNIVLDGNSRIKQVKAFDTNGTLVDLHIDINDDMNIDDIMQKVYESAAAMGITDDKIIIDISDQNGNSRAWVRAEDILLKDEIVSKTGDDIKIEESADDVINDLPHNISDADKLRNEVDNNQDTVSNTTNGFFSDIKNAVTKVAGSLSNAAIAKMEKANKTAKIHEEMSKVANDIIKNTIDNGTDNLKSFGNNIDKENLKINKDFANGVSFFENVGSKLQDIASENLANSIEAKKIKSQILSSSAEEMKSKLSSGLKNLSQVGANFNDVSKENFNLYKDFNNATEFLSSGAIAISDSFHGFIADSSKLLENANDWLVNDALPVIEDVSSTVSNALKRTGATVGTAALSLIEGVGKLGEAIVDAGATILIGAASIVTLVVDGGGYFYSDITGKKWNSVTEYMWDTTKAFVAKKHVANWFDSLYENSAAGKWLKTNAFFFNNVREVSSGIGYTVGIIGLTLATGGVGGIAGGTAGVAGIAGVGKGVEDAWGKGASTVGGLASGALNGLWEGFQFFVGAKINGINVFGKSAPTIKTKLINGLIHVALDGVDGGAEGFARTLIDTCYKDGYTDDNGNYVKYTDADSILKKLQENFDDLGGFNTVLTGAISGMATSAMSEALDLGKYFKEKTAKNKIDNVSETFQSEETIGKNISENATLNSVDSSTPIAEFNQSNNEKIFFDDLEATSEMPTITLGEMETKASIDNSKFDAQTNLASGSSPITISELERYNKLVDLKNSDAYKSYINRVKMGEPVVRNPVFDSLEKELDILDKKISPFSFSDLEATAEMPTITLGEMGTKAPIDNSKIDAQTNLASGSSPITISELERYNKLVDLKNSDAYKSYINRVKMGEPVVRNPVFDSLEKELDILDKKISPFSFSDLEATAEMPTITLGEMESATSIGDMKPDSYSDLSSGNISESKVFSTYQEFCSNYKALTDDWVAKLSSKELKVIHNYIGESNYSSYATINGLLRGSAVDYDTKTINLYHAFGNDYHGSFDTWKNEFGESVEDFVRRTYDEAITLNDAISRNKFIEDTTVFRGVDMNALASFGITSTDTSDEILKKLGAVYTDNGFMSCSPISTGGFTSKSVNFVMKCKKGMSFADFSKYNSSEKEILLGMGSKFSIDSVEKKGGKIYVYMTGLT